MPRWSDAHCCLVGIGNRSPAAPLSRGRPRPAAKPPVTLRFQQGADCRRAGQAWTSGSPTPQPGFPVLGQRPGCCLQCPALTAFGRLLALPKHASPPAHPALPAAGGQGPGSRDDIGQRRNARPRHEQRPVWPCGLLWACQARPTDA